MQGLLKNNKVKGWHDGSDRDTCKMPGITNMPPVELHIMENEVDATGVGEPGLAPFVPVLTNAINDLTGKRIRKFPFDLKKV